MESDEHRIFLPSPATRRAEQVLERANRIALRGDAFERFVAALEFPQRADADGLALRNKAEPDPPPVSAGAPLRSVTATWRRRGGT